jgi:hypothetical protein
LIYTPPPLDKVWLDEEGLHKRSEQLLDQHRRVEHQTQIKKQAVPIPQTDDASGPAPQHPIISEDTSVSDDDASEVQNKMIIMGHQISSCHVLLVSFFIL